jgi:four helix bundle protein
MIGGFEQLDLWKLAHKLALDLYRESERFPRREQFGITQQLRRAALSIPTNVAEGSARQYHQEFLQFCNIARGSAAEVRYLLRFALDMDWIDNRGYERFADGYDRVGQMLNALINYLRKQHARRRTPHG